MGFVNQDIIKRKAIIKSPSDDFMRLLASERASLSKISKKRKRVKREEGNYYLRYLTQLPEGAVAIDLFEVAYGPKTDSSREDNFGLEMFHYFDVLIDKYKVGKNVYLQFSVSEADLGRLCQTRLEKLALNLKPAEKTIV